MLKTGFTAFLISHHNHVNKKKTHWVEILHQQYVYTATDESCVVYVGGTDKQGGGKASYWLDRTQSANIT